MKDDIEEALYLTSEKLIKPFEGYHVRLPDGGCKAYPDPATGGHPYTIGWGSTGPDVKPDTVWTEKQAADSLKSHVMYFMKGVVVLSPSLLKAEPRRIAAIISFCYNCGLGNYRISILRKRVNDEDWEGAAKEILKWDKAAGRKMRGLTRRRMAESEYLK